MMTESTEEKTVVADYAFRFNALPERVIFTGQIKITGWLLHRKGLPIHGIRGIVRGILRRRWIFRARRKRSRPLIAAAYPDVPEAGQSGFLLLLELPVGRSEITIQVQDHRKIWRTIFVTDVWAFPLTFLGRIRLPRVERFLSSYLAQLFVGNRQNAASSVKPHSLSQIEGSLPRERLQSFTGEPGSTQCVTRAVDLFVTSKSNLFIREIADLLCAGFRATGCEAQLLIDQIPAETSSFFFSRRLPTAVRNSSPGTPISSRHITVIFDWFQLDSQRRKRREVICLLHNATPCCSGQRSC